MRTNREREWLKEKMIRFYSEKGINPEIIMLLLEQKGLLFDKESNETT